MKYTKNQIQYITEAVKAGKGNTFIANKLRVSESGIRGFRKRELGTIKEGARILAYDVETTPSLVYTFGRFNVNIGQDNVVKEGGEILMASYRWLHEDKTKFIGCKEWVAEGTNDANCAAELWELFNSADVVLGQNVRSFDNKVLQTSCLKSNLPPLPVVQVIDTLKMARKHFRFNSNKLDSLGSVLGVGRKVKHSGIQLWIDVIEGKKGAFEEMQNYCTVDTERLVEVYNILRNRGLVSSFNAANYYNDNEERCGTCGSTKLDLTGRVITTSVSKFHEVRCGDCGTISRTRKNLNSKEKTKSLIVRV